MRCGAGDHDPTLSGTHDAALSATHNPVVSQLDDDGTPVIDLDELLGLLGGSDAVPSSRRVAADSRTGTALRVAADSPCSADALGGESFDVVRLDDELSIGLGYGPGAQLATLGECVQVLLPPEFEFRYGWQAAPAGAIIDLGDGLDGLALAEAGDPPPDGSWTLDFFVPDATSAGSTNADVPPSVDRVTLARGFTAVAYLGPAGGSVAEWVSALGGGVDAVYRFNAGSQLFESYRTDGPAFLNSLSRLNPGDALLVQASRRFEATLTNGGVAPSSGRLERGANFVTHLGAAAPIRDVLGGVAGVPESGVESGIRHAAIPLDGPFGHADSLGSSVHPASRTTDLGDRPRAAARTIVSPSDVRTNGRCCSAPAGAPRACVTGTVQH